MAAGTIVQRAPRALGYCISEGHSDLANLLLERGAAARGTVYGGLDAPLHAALRDPEMVEALLSRGAVFRSRSSRAAARKARDQRFHWELAEDEAAWVQSEIRPLLPPVPFEDKALFHNANAQGGSWESDLKLLLYDDREDLIRRYQPRGLDVRLSAEELMMAITWKANRSLAHLLNEMGDRVRDQVFACVRAYNPDFDRPKTKREP